MSFSQDNNLLAINEVEELTVNALRGLGLTATDAKDVAEILITADLMGIRTHGINRVLSYGERINVGGIKVNGSIEEERLSNSISRIKGDNSIGPLLGKKALSSSMKMAEEQGVGITFVNGSNHFGPIMPYCYYAAERGFASFICSNATTTIAPTGGKSPMFGNNPLGFGVPNPDGNHVILDMALSVVARAKIRDAKENNSSIPDSWATGTDGLPTTDPNEALKGLLQPVGGHKGYGLALVVDLLSGLLSNAAYLTHVKAWDKQPDQPQNLGHFFLVFDTKLLGSTDWLAERMNDFTKIIHSTSPINPDNPVILPGEKEQKLYEDNMEKGLSYSNKFISEMSSLASKSNSLL